MTPEDKADSVWGAIKTFAINRPIIIDEFFAKETIARAIREAVEAERAACAEVARGIHSEPGRIVKIPPGNDLPSWARGYNQAKDNIAKAIEQRGKM